MIFQTIKFLMKNRVKYFNSFFTISNAIPNLFGTKMISTKSSINGESFTRFEGGHCNHGRTSVESPIFYFPGLFYNKQASIYEHETSVGAKG
jgi:hypothetical protein